jgi:hypothetical protein
MLLSSRPRPSPALAAAVVAVLLWLALFWHGPLINDVAWQMWIGERLNGGARLYVDILEINPPLWFWLGAGVQGLSEKTGVGAVQALFLLFAATAVAGQVLALALARSRWEQGALVGSLIAFLLLSSPYALGQREQFAFLAVVPWIMLAGRHAERVAVAPWLAVAIGVLAASGLLLKPYLLIVPLALEAWLLMRAREWRRWPRPEVVALIFAGAAYGVAILWLTPEYLSAMVPLIRTAYAGYDSDLAGLLLGPDVVAPLLMLAGCLAASRTDRPATLGASLVAGAAFLVAGLWQFKGFAYHFLPALGFALLAVALSLPRLKRASAVPKACVLLGVVLAGATVARESARSDGFAAAATSDLPRGATVLMLSESASAAWPLIAERGFIWPSRHMAQWMLAEVWLAKAQGRSSPQLERLGRSVVREAAADIVRSRPSKLLFDRRYDPASGGIVDFFEAEPSFAAAMQSYWREPDVGYLEVYRRKAP